MSRALLVHVVACLAGLCGTLPAAAQNACCRLTTEPGLECKMDEGLERLEWRRSCLRYGFATGAIDALAASSRDPRVDVVERLTPARVRGAFARSFETWTEVTCASGERTGFFVEQLDDPLDEPEASFSYGIRNEMAVVVHDADVWVDELEYSGEAFAQTSIWHDPDTGEIFDADIEINLGRGPYADCESTCDSRAADLRNTITHEVGHLFGLAHAEVAGSTMAASARLGETEKRTLLSSDAACLCQVYPPGQLPDNECVEAGQEECSCGPAPIYDPPKQAGCGCAVLEREDGAARLSGALLGLLGLCAVLRLRSRRRRA